MGTHESRDLRGLSAHSLAEPSSFADQLDSLAKGLSSLAQAIQPAQQANDVHPLTRVREAVDEPCISPPYEKAFPTFD